MILRSSRDLGKDEEGFLLLPDMNWDRKTMGSLRILGLVERRDLWSLRDLRKRDVGWLEGMCEKIVKAVAGVYEGVEEDMLKVYVHCRFAGFSIESLCSHLFVQHLLYSVLLLLLGKVLLTYPRPANLLPLSHPRRLRLFGA